MVKGTSRRVVVVDSPDRRFFEQAIFIVRSDAAAQGVSARQLVEEARRVAREYARRPRSPGARLSHRLAPLFYALLGAAATALAWGFVAFF